MTNDETASEIPLLLVAADVRRRKTGDSIQARPPTHVGRLQICGISTLSGHQIGQVRTAKIRPRLSKKRPEAYALLSDAGIQRTY